VTKRNGEALPVPIPVVNGRAQLGVGVYEVDWTASDGSNESHATQQVTVGTKIQAAQSFILGDRARLEASAGGFAQVYNSGSETTRIGNDAKSAGILSVAPVTVQHRAIVSGAVLSAAGVTVDSDATVTGSVTRFGSVTLPALPSLPTFPAPSGGNRTLNSGATTLAAGSYGDVIVNSGAELRLGSGDYFFRSFLVNSSSSIVKANPATRVFVLNQLALRSSFKTSSNAIESVFLGFAGSAVTLEAAFDGTFLAPNAFASFGTGSALTFKGSFLARSIEARSGTALVCK
jgi:hypothetical protein